jgi:hypothetical protein
MTPLTTLLAQIREADEKDWKEDFQHENGNYECICCSCGDRFFGHKRRVQCKQCYTCLKLYRTVIPLLARMLEAVEEIATNRGDKYLLACLNSLAQEAINHQKK